ncbi:hypothetical protein HRbin23_00026 [bacterium HR23]|nr:hypothetical protein HRbin23_00026 [bacterium HR23]
MGRLLPVVFLLLVVGGCAFQRKATPTPGLFTPATPAEGDTALLTRTDRAQGGVTVEATLVTPEHLRAMGKPALEKFPLGEYLLFHVKVDTHSVDLGRYNLVALSALQWDTQGRLPSTAWVPLQESAHHREGVLVFAYPGEKGLTGRGELALVIKGLAGVPERILRWGTAR